MTPELLNQYVPEWLDTRLLFLLCVVGSIVAYFLSEAIDAMDELDRNDRAIKKSYQFNVTPPIGSSPTGRLQTHEPPRFQAIPPKFQFYSPASLIHQHMPHTTQLAPSLTIEPHLVLWHVADRLSVNRTGHHIFTGCTSMEAGDLAAVTLLLHLYNKLILEGAWESMAQLGPLDQ